MKVFDLAGALWVNPSSPVQVSRKHSRQNRAEVRHPTNQNISIIVVFTFPSQHPVIMELDTAVLEHVRSHWTHLIEKSPIYQFLLKDIDIFEASKGCIKALLKILPIHLNSKNALHGTVSACLVDWAGGLAIASTGLEKTGVSTDIHTTYISTASGGDVLLIEGTATKVGGTLAFTNVSIQKFNDDGSKSPIASGTHTKYVAVRKPQQ